MIEDQFNFCQSLKVPAAMELSKIDVGRASCRLTNCRGAEIVGATDMGGGG